MKVLILHQHFKTPQTGGAIRSYYLAKALKEHGHEPVVVTADHEGNERVEMIEGIEIRYVSVVYDNSFGFYARGWSFLKFVFLAGGEARRVGKVDLCYAISVPITVSIIARWMRFWRRVPYILEVGDLWPDAPIELGFVKNELFKKLLFRIERLAYRKAKAIVALSPDIKKVVESRAPGKSVYLVPNMSDCEFFTPEVKSPSLERDFGVQGKFVISYVGALGFANGLDYLLECARMSLKASLPVHFLVAGDGALRDRLIKNASDLGLTNVTFLPFTDRDGVKRIMNVTDAVFVCYRNAKVLSTGSPNKFFDGLAAGKMIIVNFTGWIEEQIIANNCGVVLDARNPTDFVAKMSPVVQDRLRINSSQESARKLALSRYDSKKLTAQWVGWLSSQ